MTIELSDQQLDEVRRGEPVAIRSPEFAEPLLICPRSEFASVVLSVIQEIREQRDPLTNEELREEIEDALVRRVWAEMGTSARDQWARENPF